MGVEQSLSTGGQTKVLLILLFSRPPATLFELFCLLEYKPCVPHSFHALGYIVFLTLRKPVVVGRYCQTFMRRFDTTMGIARDENLSLGPIHKTLPNY